MRVRSQAAGRIHRLGQTKDVLIKRFCYRASIEERIDCLHEHIRSGKCAVANGKLPASALLLLHTGQLGGIRAASRSSR